MNRKISPFFPSTQSAIECAQQILDCTAELIQSQLNVTEKVCSHTSSGYRAIMRSADPSAIINHLPRLIKTTVDATTRGATAYLSNGFNYQHDMMNLIQKKLPEMNRQFIKRVMEDAYVSAAE